MRGINAKQKKLLKQAIDRYKTETGNLPVSVEELPEFYAIMNINCNEEFWSASERFLSDWRFSDFLKTK